MSKTNPKVQDDNSHLLDLDALINQIVDSGLDPTIFDVDLDVKFAKNVIEFALSPEYMNTLLFARQAEQAVRLFLDYCPACTDKDFIEDVPVDASMGTFRSKVILLEHGVCPSCQKNRCELFETIPYELVSCLGQRSGKTALAGGIIFPYYVHRFLEIKNPSQYYGLMSNTLFQMTFVAVTATQAYETLWQQFKQSLLSSPWFKDYMKKLKDVEKERDYEKGTLIKVMDTLIWFGNKQLGISYAAADMKSLRGRTRVAAGIDELGWFNSKEAVRANADETYAALANSLRTVRSAADKLWKNGDYKALPGLMVNISSPSSLFDKIMRLLKEGERDKRKACFHLASWEANPNITRESLHSDEMNNPVVFWRDFGAQPPVANNPFIESASAIKDLNSGRKALFNWKTEYVKDKVTNKNRYVGAKLITSQFTDRMTPRIITVDGGETQNAFAINVMHMERSADSTESEFTIYTDAVIEVRPEKIKETEETIPVHFPSMFQIILDLCNRQTGLNIRAVLYDRWQSTGEVQRLRDLRIKAERYSPKEQDFKNFRNLVYSGNFRTPKWEYDSVDELDITDLMQVRAAPYTHLALQCATVREIGRKVVKPEAGDDDLFRTCVLGAYYLLENKKEFLVASTGERQGAVVGSLRLRSAGRMGPSFQATRPKNQVGAVRGMNGFKRR
jgi:hypothetical protein